jgi:hypothetical protein
MTRRIASWFRRVNFPFLLVPLTVAVALIVIFAAYEFRPGPPANHYSSVPATVALGGAVGALGPGFFGVNVHDVGIGPGVLSARVNATPLTIFRFTPQGEATNQITGLTYTNSGVADPALGFTDPEFVSWCEWTKCQAVMMVPAEINSTAIAVATVEYVENVLGFHPAYWAVGNEPQEWTHFGIPWAQWQITDESGITPLGYAQLVVRYAQALRAVDPQIRIIGLESAVGGPAAGGWFQNVSRVAGPYISAIAYHAYPGGNGTAQSTLQSFYAAIGNPANFPGNYAPTVAMIRAACPSCNLSVFVDEFNGALGGNYRSYVSTYPDAVVIAAGLVSAALDNVSRVFYFDLADLDSNLPYAMLLTGGAARPTYTLYSTILENLTLGTIHNCDLGGAGEGTYSLDIQNGSRASLLVVNTNLSEGVRLVFPAGWAKGATATVWNWSASALDPIVSRFATSALPSSWIVAPQGIFLVNLQATSP